MYKPVTVVEVLIWGARVGAVTLNERTGFYIFQYSNQWLRRGIELSPFTMPIKDGAKVHQFTNLSIDTFKRLPAMLSDALPDKFGNALIDAALSDEGVSKELVTSLDRLAYLNKRGMGALEFKPAVGVKRQKATAIDMALLVEGARNVLKGNFNGDNEAEAAIRSIIHVGISAGGARAKAVIAWNPKTEEIRSGQMDVSDGFEHWLLKLDGVGSDMELGTTANYGRIEYAYYLMALEASIDIMPSRLLEENGRAHFMTKRYDRDGNTKHHTQSLCALKELDFNLIDAHSYSQYFETINGLGLGVEAMQEGFRRMAFNYVAANYDDHTKNFSFLLKEDGRWSLAPAYDITHAHNPNSKWTKQHLMSVNGETLNVAKSDFMAVADLFKIQDANGIIDDVLKAVGKWQLFAGKAGVPEQEQLNVSKDFRMISK